MDIRLFWFTSLLIGLFCTSSWASNHNRNSGKYANLGQDSIPSDCLPRDIFLNSSSNPTFLTIKPPRDDFWMEVYLRLYNHSNGEQSISQRLYDRIFFYPIIIYNIIFLSYNIIILMENTALAKEVMIENLT